MSRERLCNRKNRPFLDFPCMSLSSNFAFGTFCLKMLGNTDFLNLSYNFHNVREKGTHLVECCWGGGGGDHILNDHKSICMHEVVFFFSCSMTNHKK